MADSIVSLLQTALATMQRDNPGGHRSFLDALGPTSVGVIADTLPFVISTVGGGPVVSTGIGAADVGIRTDRSTVVSVIEGEITLTDAVVQGSVEVRGALAHVVTAHDALLAFVDAAVRTPSLDGLLDQLRGSPQEARP